MTQTQDKNILYNSFEELIKNISIEQKTKISLLNDLQKLETYKKLKQEIIWQIGELKLPFDIDNVIELYEKNIKENQVTLKQVHDTYKKWFYIEDTKRIDFVLAVALSKKLEGIPLWAIIVGASGDMKSVQLNSFSDEDVYVLHNLTSKTLVNGHKNKIEFPDLAPKLNNKLVIIPDMAQILKLAPIEKGELWGQLRDLYDGLAGKESGQGASSKYSGLKITLLAGSTPAIDGQILVHQDLGTRELIYRTSGSKNKQKVMEKCFENESQEKLISETLKNITSKFINDTEIKKLDVAPDVLDEIKNIALYITYMRATAEFDNYSNELRNIVYPEEPTRIAKQLKRLYICLKNLSNDYLDEEALKILWHTGRSSAFPVRIDLFDFLLRNKEKEYSTSQLSEILKIGKSTAKRECLVMENIGLVYCRRVETSFIDKFYEYWKINMNKVESFINLKPSKNIIERGQGGSIYSYYISLDGLKVDVKAQILSLFEAKPQVELPIQEFIDNMVGLGVSESDVKEIIDNGLKAGDWFESKSGWLKKL